MEINTPDKLPVCLGVKNLCLRAILPQHLQCRIGIASSMPFDRLQYLLRILFGAWCHFQWHVWFVSARSKMLAMNEDKRFMCL